MAQEITMNDLMEAIMGVNERITSEVGSLRQEMNKRFSNVDKRFDVIDARLHEHDLRFDSVEAKLDQVSVSRMNIMESDIKRLALRMKAMQDEIDSMKKAQ